MGVTVIRTVVVFAALILLMRVMGKRELGEMQLSDLIVSVLIANLAALPIQDIDMPLINGVIPIVVLFACEMIISDATLRSVKLRALLYGKPCMLIKDGKIIQSHMRSCRFTIDELTEELRGKSITDISTVKYAVLETDGTLNAVQYESEQPATARQLGVQAQALGYPYTVIDNGRVLSHNLRLSGHDMNWLDKQLKARGASSPQDVYALIVYGTGEVYYAAKEDK